MSSESQEQKNKRQQEHLEKMLSQTDEDYPDAFFYGYYDGNHGWHKISQDYPSFYVYYIGPTYDDAVAYVNEVVSEYNDELEADEEDMEEEWVSA